ncbi:MAG: M23 family metallopeptidase [Nodosilinea sp.]
MVGEQQNNLESQRPLGRGAAYRSLGWVQATVLLSGLGLASGDLAVADAPISPEVDESIKTSADYLMPAALSTHQPSPSASVSLDSTSASAAQPHFSVSRSSPSVTLPSPPPGPNPMQPPVPPVPPAAIMIPAPAAAPTMAESLLRPSTTPVAAQPDGVLAPETDAAVIPVANPAPSGAATAESAVPAEIATDEAAPAGYGAVFIDPTSYDVGATQAPAVAPDVVLADRSTGCQVTAPGGQTTLTSSCGAAAQPGAGAVGAGGDRGIQVGPISVSPRGVSLGSTTIISRELLNERIRPLNVLRRGNEEYVFPLAIPASISSLFGWRMHPVHQSWRFHSGTDLAAPLGTPVLASQAGRVAVSDFLGGYGLTVVLRHGEGNLESRYAHLSQIAVQPGEWVEQGEVIGLVGSTGTSTGPHLHYEMRELTDGGWVAVDPIEILEYGMANLLEIIDNPMLALNRTAAGDEADPTLAEDYPFRPAQPNAS